MFETNPLEERHKEMREAISETVDLNDYRLDRVTRLRLITDPGFPFYDLSYCYGQLHDGSYVRVRLPEWQFPRRGLKVALVEMCKNEGVYAKRLHLLDADVISTLA